MKKTFFFLFFLCLFSITSFAQIDEQQTNGNQPLIGQKAPTSVGSDLSEKVMLGGNFSLYFSSTSLIEVSPLIGYNIKPGVTVGASLTYMYFSYKNDIYSYSGQNFGGGLFAKIKVYKGFYAQVEPEWLNFVYVDQYLQTQRKWAFNALAGFTYRSRIGERLAVDYSVLWNINQTSDSPYENPIVKIAFVY